MARRPHPLRTVGRALLASAVLVVAATLIECAVMELMGDARYRTLTSSAETAQRADTGGNAERDGPLAQALLANDEVVGWVTVSGTGIDYPVVQPSADKPADYYLSHDLWGSRNPAGCPFLDTRSSPLGQHLLIYAHRMGVPGSMFNDIARADIPSTFSSLGDLTWRSADGSRRVFAPMCALRVDKRFSPIQVFSWPQSAELRAWLSDMVGKAACKSGVCQDICRSAQEVITLATCTSAADPDARTLVLFAAP